MTFEHRDDDVVLGCRFREDVYGFLEAKMHNKNYNPNRKRQYGRSTTHLPLKSVHTVLDEQLRRLMKLETDGAKHSFTFGDVLRVFVQHFPELKTKKKNELGGNTQ